MDTLGANVMDYGAVGDGITDDAAAFQAAANNASQIFVPPRRFALSGITLNRGSGIRGIVGVPGNCLVPTGPNKVLIDVSGAAYNASLAPFGVSGITFDGAGVPGTCAYRENAAYSTTIQNVVMRNLEYAAVFNRGRGITIDRVDQWGTGTWNFSGVNSTDHIFEISVSNVNHQSAGGANWLHPWFAFYRAVASTISNVATASLDGTGDGISIEGACEGTFISNVILVYPKNGIRATSTGNAPTYIYLSNVGVDQTTVSAIDILGDACRLSNVNATFGALRANGGAGIVVRAGSHDIDMTGIRVANMNHNGIEIENGVMHVRGRGIYAKDNHYASGYDVQIYDNPASAVWFDGKQIFGTTHATAQTI